MRTPPRCQPRPWSFAITIGAETLLQVSNCMVSYASWLATRSVELYWCWAEHAYRDAEWVRHTASSVHWRWFLFDPSRSAIPAREICQLKSPVSIRGRFGVGGTGRKTFSIERCPILFVIQLCVSFFIGFQTDSEGTVSVVVEGTKS